MKTMKYMLFMILPQRQKLIF
ncbi:UNVERIFIED_CONTAM: hypothetical protein GTU68_048971 [Idotea baltica]|nr:hypothetical protein [Idotea baltica]